MVIARSFTFASPKAGLQEEIKWSWNTVFPWKDVVDIPCYDKVDDSVSEHKQDTAHNIRRCSPIIGCLKLNVPVVKSYSRSLLLEVSELPGTVAESNGWTQAGPKLLGGCHLVSED